MIISTRNEKSAITSFRDTKRRSVANNRVWLRNQRWRLRSSTEGSATYPYRWKYYYGGDWIQKDPGSTNQFIVSIMIYCRVKEKYDINCTICDKYFKVIMGGYCRWNSLVYYCLCLLQNKKNRFVSLLYLGKDVLDINSYIY